MFSGSSVSTFLQLVVTPTVEVNLILKLLTVYGYQVEIYYKIFSKD